MYLGLKDFLAKIPLGRGLLPVLAVCFVLVRLAERQGSAPVWLTSYGDDLLSLPLVLGAILTVHRWTAGDRRTLPLSHGLLAVVVFAVYFELILPAAGTGAVADPLDVLMYLAGFLVFQVFINRSVNPSPVAAAPALVLLLVAGMVGTVPALAVTPDAAAPDSLISFSLKDQFDKLQTSGSLSGAVAVVVSGDRKGHPFMKEWSPALRDSLAPAINGFRVRVVDHAHLKGAPFFVKGKIKGMFVEENENSVLMDWQGVFKKAYDLTEDHCSILVFDAGGLLRHRAAVAHADPVVLAELLERIRELAD